MDHPREWSKRLLPGAAQLGRMLAIYGLLGVLAGLTALVFVTLVHETGHLVLGETAGIDPTARGLGPYGSELALPSGGLWWLLLIPGAGFLISGLLSAYFAPETMGTGTGGIIDAYHRKGGVIRRRVPLVKMLASAATIGSGGSAGVEGPVGFIAGGIGSTIGRIFKLPATERRILVMAGFAAGIGAVFHAPMAASVFAAEVLYRELDLEHEVLVPSIIASTLAYAVYGAVHGWDAIWVLPKVQFDSVVELVPYLVLAIVCALGGRLFIALEHGFHRAIGANERLPLWVRPAIGGVLVGVIGLFFPQVIGVGYGVAQLAIDGKTGLLVLLVLAVAKMFTSALTAGTGGSGGLFAPSLVIGGVLGSAVAAATNSVAPGLGVDPAAFAVVGMAGFFAAVINAPISTVIMVSELVGSYRLLVPTLWVCVIAWFAARKYNLYAEQVANRMAAPGHVADMMTAVLHRIRVKNAMEPGKAPPVTVSPNTRLRDLVRHFAGTIQGVFPIIEPRDGRLVGVVDGWALRRTVGESGIDDMLVAADFLAPALTAHPEDHLDAVVEEMAKAGFDEVLIVENNEKSTLVGILSRREIVSAYHREMLSSSGAGAGAGADGGAKPTRGPSAKPGVVDLGVALARGGVVHALRGHTRSEVLEDLVNRAALPAGIDKKRLLAQLIEREQLGSTYVGDGIAFPHPSSTEGCGIELPVACIATTRKPVPWADAP
ncbi:MAG: chloride channel protein, partial [Myxococcales bacterium]|nr:chloride channel protein [Myxococcales bacterium]